MLPGTVLLVGAGLAGARAAETLRANGYAGRVLLVGDEPTAPYERPALSKEYLAGKKTEEQLLLRRSHYWGDLGIELLLGRHVSRIEPALRTARLADGEELPWDALVLATGARPRRLPFAAPRGVQTLRTLADAQALRASLVPGARLAVVGGGFIGAEVASTALGLAVEVTMVEALRGLLRAHARGRRRKAPRGALPIARSRPPDHDRRRGVPCRPRRRASGGASQRRKRGAVRRRGRRDRCRTRTRAPTAPVRRRPDLCLR